MMKVLLSGIIGLAAVASGFPSDFNDGTILGRAINDKCSALEGSGFCQKTSNCAGISYPTGLCPKDPVDVQCCVEIGCSVPKTGSGYCRSVKNNGCSGGTFHSGFCPGDDDIKCCVKSTPPKPPPVTRAPSCSRAAYNELMFEDSMSAFQAAKSAKDPSCFKWGDDGCSCSPDNLGNFDFLDFLSSCERHDFGYRNAKKMGIFTDKMKKKIDSNFANDLDNFCSQFDGWESWKGVICREVADEYVSAVRVFGKKKKKMRMVRDVSGTLQKRACTIGGITFDD